VRGYDRKKSQLQNKNAMYWEHYPQFLMALKSLPAYVSVFCLRGLLWMGLLWIVLLRNGHPSMHWALEDRSKNVARRGIKKFCIKIFGNEATEELHHNFHTPTDDDVRGTLVRHKKSLTKLVCSANRDRQVGKSRCKHEVSMMYCKADRLVDCLDKSWCKSLRVLSQRCFILIFEKCRS